MSKMILGLAVGAVLAAAPAADAAFLAGYYVARDNNALVGGNPNPNFGRLTFLYNHGDHFHSIGRFGAAEGRLPETFVGGRIEMQPGTGPFAGRYVSRAYTDPARRQSEYSNMEVRSIHTLAGFPAGSDEAILYGSSAGRWSTLPLTGAQPVFEIVSMSPGLQLGNADGTGLISAPGQRLPLGDGQSFSLLPMFVTDPSATVGNVYAARLRLVDTQTGTPFGESGVFRFEFQITSTPAPGGLLAVALAAPAVVGLVRRRRAN